jgi:hypothetical protein
VNGANGTMPSSRQRPASTVAPSPRASSAISTSSRVLPLPGSPVDGHDRRGPGTGLPPGRPQGGERLAPADERRVRAVRKRVRQRGRPHARRWAIGAQLLDERARLLGRRDAEIAPQDDAERLIRRDRRRAVPATTQPAHEHPCGILRRGIELEPAARVRHGGLQVVRRLGRLADGRQQLADTLALRLARLEDPIVVEVDEQLIPAQRQRIGPAVHCNQALDLAHVDPEPGAVGDAHALPLRDDVAAGGLSQFATQRRERRPQARPSAALQHIRPEDCRHPRPRVQPRVIRQPAQQRPRPTARDGLQPPPLQLETKLAQETDAQHLMATLAWRTTSDGGRVSKPRCPPRRGSAGARTRAFSPALLDERAKPTGDECRALHVSRHSR